MSLDDGGRRSIIRARRAYVVLAWAFSASVVFQVFLLGIELFEAGGGELHREFAYLYGWLLPAMLLLGRFGRLPVGTVVMTAGLLVLYALQTVMPAFSGQLPLLGPLHAVNALVLFGLGILLAQRAGRATLPSGGEG